MLDLAGTVLSAEDRELLQHPAVGGVILFARNYQNPAQLAALTAAIRAVREPHLLVAVDQEGGRVQRFREGFKRLPPAGYYAALYQQSPDAAKHAAQRMGWLMAVELQAVGVDFSFAPVLDIDRTISRVIGDRAFGQQASTVMALTGAWMQGARLAGMVSVGKHFPGHGGVTADSHTALPCDERAWATLWMEDLAPFGHLIAQGLEAVMPSHVVYPCVDDVPAGFSARWLQSILREQMGFQGAIFSDALDMAAATAAGDFVGRATAALAAGCDQLLMCNNRAAAVAVVEALADYRDPAAQARLARLYSRHFTPLHYAQQQPYWAEAETVLAQFATDTTSGMTLAYDPTTRSGTVL
jgi:beta-N-acetylhexosaminidase